MIAASVLRGGSRSSQLLAETVAKRLRVSCPGSCGGMILPMDASGAEQTGSSTHQQTRSLTARSSLLPALEFSIRGPYSASRTFRGQSQGQNMEWPVMGGRRCRSGINHFSGRLGPTSAAFGFVSRRWLGCKSSRSYCSSLSLSSSIPSARDSGARTDNSLDDRHSTGAASFQRYIETKQQIDNARSEMERTKSLQLYKAWESAEGKAKEDEEERTGRASRRGGVAVVKTLVRQVNEEARMQDRVVRNLQDLESQAQAYLEDSALQHHHPQALLVLGNQCLEEREDPHRAMELWKLSGTGTGWFNVGHLLWAGYESDSSKASPSNAVAVPIDRAEAMLAFERAVELGDADAMFFVGVEKLSEIPNEDSSDGESSSTSLQSAADLRRGIEYLERAAELGHGGAMYYLALLHLQGSDRIGIPPCGDAEFARRLNLACDEGQHPDAWFLRGHCYYRGDHTYPHNVRRALEDFLRAADAGHADAAVSAGAILFQGAEGGGKEDGVSRDRRRAFELYQHAGELGSLDGWRNVVACYATGQGVPQSLETAQYIAHTMLPPEKDGPTDGSSY